MTNFTYMESYRGTTSQNKYSVETTCKERFNTLTVLGIVENYLACDLEGPLTRKLDSLLLTTLLGLSHLKRGRE